MKNPLKQADELFGENIGGFKSLELGVVEEGKFEWDSDFKYFKCLKTFLKPLGIKYRGGRLNNSGLIFYMPFDVDDINVVHLKVIKRRVITGDILGVEILRQKNTFGVYSDMTLVYTYMYYFNNTYPAESNFLCNGDFSYKKEFDELSNYIKDFTIGKIKELPEGYKLA